MVLGLHTAAPDQLHPGRLTWKGRLDGLKSSQWKRAHLVLWLQLFRIPKLFLEGKQSRANLLSFEWLDEGPGTLASNILDQSIRQDQFTR